MVLPHLNRFRSNPRSLNEWPQVQRVRFAHPRSQLRVIPHAIAGVGMDKNTANIS